MYFYEEELKEVNITTQINHVNLSKIFDNIKPTLRSELKTEFLKRDDSIFSAILNQKDKRVGIFDLSFFTNKNIPVFKYLYLLSLTKFFIANTVNNIPRHITADSGNNKYSNVYWFNINTNEARYISISFFLFSGFIMSINILEIIYIDIAKNIRFFKVTRPANQFTVDTQIDLIEGEIMSVKEAAI